MACHGGPIFRPPHPNPHYLTLENKVIIFAQQLCIKYVQLYTHRMKSMCLYSYTIYTQLLCRSHLSEIYRVE
jgi:hypothetical protein